MFAVQETRKRRNDCEFQLSTASYITKQLRLLYEEVGWRNCSPERCRVAHCRSWCRWVYSKDSWRAMNQWLEVNNFWVENGKTGLQPPEDAGHDHLPANNHSQTYHHHHQFIYSTKQYKYIDKRWYKWSWNGNDKADSTYSHPSVLKT